MYKFFLFENNFKLVSSLYEVTDYVIKFLRLLTSSIVEYVSDGPIISWMCLNDKPLVKKFVNLHLLK